MRHLPVAVATACSLLLLPSHPAAQNPGPQTAGQKGAPLHVLKIAAGPAGAEKNGVFVLTEERSVFNRSVDREAVVMFQWEGVPGTHKLGVTWRSPDGGFTSNSTLDYVAKDRRFGAYWTFTLSPSMQLGTWSVEATVDGQPGGRFTFEVTDSKVSSGPAPKRPLADQELYERLQPRFVSLSRFLPGGRETDPSAGVLIDGGHVLTSLATLDGVERVRQATPDGVPREVTTVVDADRGSGWALLPGAEPAGGPLPRADAPRVGDRCYTMQSDRSGARVLVAGRIVGMAPGAGGPGGGWVAAFTNGLGTPGAPVVNEFGELIGILRSSAAPDLQAFRPGSIVEFGNIQVVPLAAVAPRGRPPLSLAELRATGLVLQPLVGETHVVSGGFAAQISRGTTVVSPEHQRQEFSRADKEMFVFVTLSPRERLRAQGAFHLFDAQNRLLASSKPSKMNVPQQQLVISSWKLAIPQTPGTYRAELHLDGKPAWRGQVRVVE